MRDDQPDNEFMKLLTQLDNQSTKQLEQWKNYRTHLLILMSIK